MNIFGYIYGLIEKAQDGDPTARSIGYIVGACIIFVLLVVVFPARGHDLHVFQDIVSDGINSSIQLTNETRLTQYCFVIIDDGVLHKVVIKSNEKSPVYNIKRIDGGYGYICSPDNDSIRQDVQNSEK